MPVNYGDLLKTNYKQGILRTTNRDLVHVGMAASFLLMFWLYIVVQSIWNKGPQTFERPASTMQCNAI